MTRWRSLYGSCGLVGRSQLGGVADLGGGGEATNWARSGSGRSARRQLEQVMLDAGPSSAAPDATATRWRRFLSYATIACLASERAETRRQRCRKLAVETS